MAARKQIDLNEVERLAGLGLTMEQIAASLGISRTTLQTRKAESEQFAQAIQKGQASGIATIANALWENARGGNVTAQIFFLKARAQWKDRHEDAGEGDDTAAPVKVEVTVRDGRKPDAD